MKANNIKYKSYVDPKIKKKYIYTLQNGVVELQNIMVVERIHSIAIEFNLSQFLWIDVISISNYLVNYSPNKANKDINI